MKRPATTVAAALTLSLALASPASSAFARGTSIGAPTADVGAAAQAILKGTHVYVAPGGPAIHAAALTTAIGPRPIFVVAVPTDPQHANDWIALLATAARVSGTYVVLTNDTLTASSNQFPTQGVEALRQAALNAHPTDRVAALDDLVQGLAAGAAKTAGAGRPTATTGTATVDALDARPRSSSPSKAPLLVVLLILVLCAVTFAVVRARRRMG